MPEPASEPIAWDPAFDPQKHCGGLKRDRTLCMMTAGQQTNHLGEGRCYLHGGRRWEGQPITGKNKTIGSPETPRQLTGLAARAKAIRDSDDLLSLENEIAITKAIFMDQISGYDAASKVWKEIQEKIDRGDYDEDDPPQLPPMPELDLRTLDTMARLVKITLDARFARRHSIPIAELEKVLGQVAQVFFKVCDDFGMPNEAKIKFAEGLKLIQLSRQTDLQLDRAGGLRETHIIDGANGDRQLSLASGE